MGEKALRVPNPYRVARFEKLDSTNAEALRLAGAGICDDTWIVAGSQDSGRGRRGRTWVSKRGNLYTSLLIFPRCELGVAGGLAFVAGLAVLGACAELAPGIAAELQLKWPNDLLLGGRKMAGLLLESSGQREEGKYALVIGWGVNCVSHPEEANYPVTDLKAAGHVVDLDHLFEAIALHFEDLRQIWQEGSGFSQIREMWLRHGAGLGREITVRLPNKELSGIFTDIDSTGQLVLREKSGTLKSISAGDVFFDQSL